MPKEIFEPDEINELLRGWHLHAHKGRERHDLAARGYDGWRTLLGIASVAASAIVGTSTFGVLQDSTNRETQVIVGALAMAAAVLAGLQSFLDLRARADLHRVAGTKYKAVIRRLEQQGIGVSELKLSDPKVNQIRKRLDDLEMEMPVVSARIYRIVEAKFEGHTFIDSVGQPSKLATRTATTAV